MVTLTQAIASYSYIDRPWITREFSDEASADMALLQQVDQLLRAAGTAYTRRQYDDAIDSYRQAESLIFAHLDPLWRPDVIGRPWFEFPRDPALLDSLLGAATQWLNVATVPGPVSPVRPPAAVDTAKLGTPATFDGAGLRAEAVHEANSAAAAADASLANILARGGNKEASDALLARARGLDAGVAGAFRPAGVHPPVEASPPVSMRNTSLDDGARSIRLHSIDLPVGLGAQRQVGVLVGPAQAPTLKIIAWPAAGAVDIEAVKGTIYAAHAEAATLPDRLMQPVSIEDRALTLPHDYYYTIPIGLAECYHALGDWPAAERNYLTAARYPYINKAVEAPYLWQRLGHLYLDWGDTLYRREKPQEARPVYERVLNADGTTPSSPLWTLPGLQTPAAAARALLPLLGDAIDQQPSGPLADGAALAVVLVHAKQRIAQIDAGLDFFGHWAPSVPIWTFRYLQQVAINFAQLAQNAEQSVINFWDRADQAKLTQTELSNQVNELFAQGNVAIQQLAAAQAEVEAYQKGLDLANKRADDAEQNALEYADRNSYEIRLAAMSQQISGGDSGDPVFLNDLVGSIMEAGLTRTSSWAPDWFMQLRGSVSAAYQLVANRVSQQYQVDQMMRTAAQMNVAAAQAQAELTAANARVAVARADVDVAVLRALQAGQTLMVFDSSTFTPGVWRTLGDAMDRLYARYMDVALRAARLMQRAYNFENDRSVTIIQSSYPGVFQGLLAADALLADIQSFTDDMLVNTRSKRQPLKTTISLAERYGYAFDTQLRKTGSMTFETTLDDFDTAYPGTYGARIKRVSVAFQGIVPPSGVSGTLTNGGISVYRLPSDVIAGNTTTKQRIQSAETLVLSDYDPTVDGPVNSSGGEMSGIFEGAGVASTWRLDLPKAVNDIDYGALTDVVLTFLYEARFDPALAAAVRKEIASRPGFTTRQRALPLRWLYPDLFYAFAATGTTTLTLSIADFRTNETKPTVTAISLLAAMRPGTAPTGLTIALAPPGKAAAAGKADAGGVITSQGAGSPWAGLTGGSALGDWVFTASAANNPGFTKNGQLDLSALINLVLVFDYSFTPRS